MIKSIQIYRFNDDKKFILHPTAQVKDYASIPTPPFLTFYNLSTEDLLEEILNLLNLVVEAERPSDMNEFQKNLLKSLGLKTFKALHHNSISLTVFLKEGLINLCPTKNLGSRKGFYGVPLNERVVIPFDSPKDEYLKALELALEKCQ